MSRDDDLVSALILNSNVVKNTESGQVVTGRTGKIPVPKH